MVEGARKRSRSRSQSLPRVAEPKAASEGAEGDGPGSDDGSAGTSEGGEDEQDEDPERALALALGDPDLERAEYYGLCSALSEHCWAFEWVSPKPGPLRGCCVVPSIAGMGLLGGRLEALGAEVVVSLGSGAGLVEWLLAARFETVVCVDRCYRPKKSGAVEPWVLPQLRAAVRASWAPGAVAGGAGLHFVHPSEAAQRLPEIAAGRSVAFFLSWPQLDVSDVAEYAEALAASKVHGMVMVQGENCSPQPCSAAEAARCCAVPMVQHGEDMRCLSEPCSVWTFPGLSGAATATVPVAAGDG